MRDAIDQISPAHIGLFFVILALGIYVFSNPARLGWYDHFVWQADAFLHGRFVIAWPVSSGPHVNAYFQDVMPLPSEPGAPSYGLLPFPPLPAVLLMPFVAIFGLATDDQLLGAILGAINVGLAWRMVTPPDRAQLGRRPGDAVLRLRHGPLVRGHAVDHLVPGPPGRADVRSAWHHSCIGR